MTAAAAHPNPHRNPRSPRPRLRPRSRPRGHYNPRWVREKFNTDADREWARLTRTPAAEVSLHIHSHYLQRHVRPGDYVLEIGAGAGRFTQVLAQLGARVVVADLSPVQLKLNRQHAVELGFEACVEERLELDVCDMGHLPTASFDAVVAYGGLLSYVFEQRGQAMTEMLRVLKPGGVIALSVMSLWGAIHQHLEGVMAVPVPRNRRIIASGDLCPATHPEAAHFCHLYRSDELRGLLEGCGTRVLDMSAANCLTGVWRAALTPFRGNPPAWDHILEMELEACRQPGCLDMGEHLIAAVRKPRTRPSPVKKRTGRPTARKGARL